MRAKRASRRSRSEREALRPTATDYRSVAKRARSASFATDRCASCTRTIERPVPGWMMRRAAALFMAAERQRCTKDWPPRSGGILMHLCP